MSAASKHTLVLDTSCRLWYFGLKERVGAAARGRELQFEPIKLHDVDNPEQKNKFVFVAAGDLNNLAIRLGSNQILQFGKGIQESNERFDRGWNTNFERKAPS